MNELMQNSLDKIDRMFAEMDDEEFLRQYNECREPLTGLYATKRIAVNHSTQNWIASKTRCR